MDFSLNLVSKFVIFLWHVEGVDSVQTSLVFAMLYLYVVNRWVNSFTFLNYKKIKMKEEKG